MTQPPSANNIRTAIVFLPICSPYPRALQRKLNDKPASRSPPRPGALSRQLVEPKPRVSAGFVSLEVLNPLGQRLRAPAERRIHRRSESAQRLVAGHDAFGQGVLGEAGAQAPHGAGEVGPVHANERALFAPTRLFNLASRAPDAVARAQGLRAPLAIVT